MSRPFKLCHISSTPRSTYFKPRGIPMRFLETIWLWLEEFEALRLKDLEGLEQEQAATKMNISRPTFQRILTKARKKLADALFYGKAVKIEGGNIDTPQRCQKCLEERNQETCPSVKDGRMNTEAKPSGGSDLPTGLTNSDGISTYPMTLNQKKRSALFKGKGNQH